MESIFELARTTTLQILSIEWIILFAIIALVLLLGPTKLPELARGIGKALGEFRRGKMEIEQEIKRELLEAPPGKQLTVEISPKLLEAAKKLGIDVLGRKERDLKVAIIKSMDTASEDILREVASVLDIRHRGLDLDQLKDRIAEALGI